MDNWDDLKFFLAVHKTGTMVSAAKLLGTNVATVSRRIERLSNEIGVSVFVKTAGNWQLNPVVEGLLRISEDIEGRLASELNLISSRAGSPSHMRLKIGAPPLITNRVLAPRIGEAFEKNPGHALELHDRVASSGLNDVDIMIRPGRPEQGRLITRRIGEIAFKIYRHKDSNRPTDWAGLTAESENCPQMRHALAYFGHPPTMRASQILPLFQLVQSTRLSAPLPVFLAETDPNMLPLDDRDEPVLLDFWVAFHNSRKTDLAIQETTKWIRDCFRAISVCDDISVES